ncbi:MULTISPECIES: hypothetical protein [unclassified Caballeronia]|uniref:hypothetical protein n=1 Tax=unclassified Caballeronia TaxID=2646786 RepID=UPI002866D5CA|nr:MULTISPECIES: hypothetical protein [unclassified Caballeronia]MDR5777090.1 hypothetical protein [Caballeronia sp. LZ002]MDR5798756.1 hypothetical protein [Caballeronia sp. LZ001]MDR5852576.1 hypothetical protein [Caballeronia sp. LZ003]
MKLARVKVEYTCGLTLTDRVSLDVISGVVAIPPRLALLMTVMQEAECSPVFSLDYKGYVLPVSTRPDGTYVVSVPPDPGPGLRDRLYAIANPSKDQRQQNGRYLHTLSAASIGGAVGYAHSSAVWVWATALGTAALVVLGVVLWYAGFLHMKGE